MEIWVEEGGREEYIDIPSQWQINVSGGKELLLRQASIPDRCLIIFAKSSIFVAGM